MDRYSFSEISTLNAAPLTSVPIRALSCRFWKGHVVDQFHNLVGHVDFFLHFDSNVKKLQ